MSDRGNLSMVGRALVTLAAFVVCVAGMRAAESILAPFLLSLFVAVVAAPPMFWLQRRRVSNTAALLIVLLLLVLIGFLLVMLVGNSANDLISQLPTYQAKLKGYLDGVLAVLERWGVEVSRDLVVQYMDPGKALGIFASTLSGVGGVLTNAVLILFTVVFLLIEANGFSAKLRGALKEPEKSYPRFQRFSDDLQRYLVIKAWMSAVTAILVLIALLIIGLDYPWLWAVLMFLLNYIPNIGPIIAAVPAVLLALVQLGPGQALAVAGAYVLANTLMGNIVEPRFMGRGVGLSTLVVFLSLVFWGWVLGPVGMLLSVPLTMAAKIALESSDDSRWLAVLLGAHEPGSGIRERA